MQSNFIQDLSEVPILRDAIFQHKQSYSAWGSDYSVTTLLNPPRIVQLKRRYQDIIDARPITHDTIVKALGSFRGTGIHNHFERMLYQHINRNPDAGYLIERRCWDRINGRKISGKFDCWHQGTLWDIKTTSAWKRVFGDFTEYEKQLNLYAWFLKQHGIPVDAIKILAWYMDWDRGKLYQKGYPKQMVEAVSIENYWPENVQKDFLYSQIDLHKENESVDDEDLPACTSEEMWEKPDKWAIYSVKNTWTEGEELPKKATRVLDTAEDAKQYTELNQPKWKSYKWHIVKRPGSRTRCVDYCDVKEFCNVYQDYIGPQSEAA